MPELFLGLDLGGTNVKAGVVDGNGKLLGKASVPTGVGPDTVIGNMIAGAKQALEKAEVGLADITAVGVASPGPLSTTEGVIFQCANLPGWKNVPLRARIAEALGRPTVLENDANAAAYGEYWAGAGRSRAVKDLVMFTLGTGVGGGIVHDGRVVHGMQDFAAEVGHMIMVPDGELCGCGQRGCLESYASASRTGQRATQLLNTTREASSLREIFNAQGAVTAHDVAAHAQHGDALARGVWETTCKFIALACVNAVHWMDPQMIVLAGGMSKAGAFLLDTVQRHFDQLYWKLVPAEVQIALAELGNDAGVIGAAGIAVAENSEDGKQKTENRRHLE